MSFDSLAQSYLNDIGKHPLLTPQQELILGRQVQEMREVKEGLKPDEVPTPEQKRILVRGARARTKMIQSNLRLVVNIAKKYQSRVKHMSLMDLIQEGSLGLVRGVELYDPSRGYRFSTYAYWWIRQGITRSIGLRESCIRMPNTLSEKLPTIRRTAQRLTQELGREPSRDELAKELSMSSEELATLLVRTSAPSSLEARVGSDGTALVDLIIDPTAPDAYEMLEEDTTLLDVGLSRLEERERMIMTLRHGLNGSEVCTDLEIGKRLGVSRQRVKQIEQKTIRKLRVFMAGARHLSNAQIAADVVSNLDKQLQLVV